MTFRAVRILKEADVIACEDTRQTRKLLDHYGIDRPTISYHEHNEAARAEELVARLREGARIALVSDAGMPLVSDPGYRVVKAAAENGIPVQPVPGASALIAALAASGLPTDAFHFAGFLPPKPGQRRSEGVKNPHAEFVPQLDGDPRHPDAPAGPSSGETVSILSSSRIAAQPGRWLGPLPVAIGGRQPIGKARDGEG
jgi:16S rRNA (cytidine1402-2'-O)-methyltransferase